MAQAANRRSYPRKLRRVQVRFWRPGEERPRGGFTKNLSVTGAFVTTPDPAGRNERLRVELVEGGRQTLLEAVVVHSHRVPPELRRFADSAMGLRFLELEELVGPFLPADAQRPMDEPAADAPRPEESTAAAGAAAGDGDEPATTAGPVWTEAPPDPAGPAAGPSAPDSSSGGAPARRRIDPPGAGERVYPLTFERPSDLVALYRRDVVNGGLFVSTSRPAKLDESVTVEIVLPGAGRRRIVAEARVVQVVEPRKVAGGRTAGGMGVELRDPDRLLRELEPVVAALEGNG